MSGGKGITNVIKFQTLDNSSKYYLKKDKVSDVDYPRFYIGLKTPSMFKWTKKEHLFNITEQAVLKNKEKIIVTGTRELTAMEFLFEIDDAKMWTFEFPLDM